MDTGTATPTATGTRWHRACDLAAIPPWTGVAALFGSLQVALIRWGDGMQVHALANLDPFSHAMVISRGIVGDCNGEAVVASPVYKQRFRLSDGTCVDDAAVRLATFPVRVVDGEVEVQIPD